MPQEFDLHTLGLEGVAADSILVHVFKAIWAASHAPENALSCDGLNDYEAVVFARAAIAAMISLEGESLKRWATD